MTGLKTGVCMEDAWQPSPDGEKVRQNGRRGMQQYDTVEDAWQSGKERSRHVAEPEQVLPDGQHPGAVPL